MTNQWLLISVFGACGVVVMLYLYKRLHNRHTPHTDQNEIVLADSPDGPIIKKGTVDDPE